MKTERDDGSWRVRVSLPVAGKEEAASAPKHRIAGSKPTAGQPWYFNIGRQRVVDLAKPELKAFPSIRLGWHATGRFGKLISGVTPTFA